MHAGCAATCTIVHEHASRGCSPGTCMLRAGWPPPKRRVATYYVSTAQPSEHTSPSALHWNCRGPGWPEVLLLCFNAGCCCAGAAYRPGTIRPRVVPFQISLEQARALLFMRFLII